MADESKYPTRIPPYGLRMPPGLKARVEAAARLNNRSMNAEIVATLEMRFPEPGSFEDLATELYDLVTSMLLAQDPKEREMLADRHREVLEEMRMLQQERQVLEE